MTTQAAVADIDAEDFRPLRRAAHLPGPLARASREELVRRSRPRRGKGMAVAAACAFAATAAAALVAGSGLPGLSTLQERAATAAQPPAARTEVALTEARPAPAPVVPVPVAEPAPRAEEPVASAPAPEEQPAFASDPNLPVGPLLAKARSLIAVGDVGGARRLAERAASGGAPEALFALAELHDPARLAEWRVFGVRADPARARSLYEQARDRGDARADARIAALR